MYWYVVYKGKPYRGTLRDNLTRASIGYYIPTHVVEHFEDDMLVSREEEVLKNLIFIQTDRNIVTLVHQIDGLRTPYIDICTGQPAIVADNDMERFIQFTKMQNINATLLKDPYQKFRTCQKVRIKAGQFAGIEGYITRIRRDRKLVIALGDMAVAISGIHHSLLEPIK